MVVELLRLASVVDEPCDVYDGAGEPARGVRSPSSLVYTEAVLMDVAALVVVLSSSARRSVSVEGRGCCITKVVLCSSSQGGSKIGHCRKVSLDCQSLMDGSRIRRLAKLSIGSSAPS